MLKTHLICEGCFVEYSELWFNEGNVLKIKFTPGGFCDYTVIKSDTPAMLGHTGSIKFKILTEFGYRPL